jgi:hypothetical protein
MNKRQFRFRQPRGGSEHILTIEGMPSDNYESFLRKTIANAVKRTALWENILRPAQTKVAAEFGVWKGNFASKILTSCEFIELYYMVDPWAYLAEWNRAKNVQTENFEDVYQQAMTATAFAESKRCVLRGTTKEVIHKIPNGSLDFAYIDGDHTLRGVTIDLIKVLPKMKPGAIIGGDDFLAKPWPDSRKFEPTMVCPYIIYFAEANDLPIFSLPFNQCLILNKPELGFSFTDITGQYADISLVRDQGERGPQFRRNPGRAARMAKRALK